MKKITRASIIGELVDKFALTEYEREEFVFGEFVVPTYDIGAHVKQWESIRSRIAITANGTIAFFTVPENERWRVRKIDVFNETGGNFDIDQIFYFGNSDHVQYLFHDPAAPLVPGTVSLFPHEQDIVMEYDQLTNLDCHIANFVAGGNVAVHMLRERELIR